MRNCRDLKRAAYCSIVEQLAVAQLPALAGRLDWDTVRYHFLQGVSPQVAADAQVRLASR